MINKVYYGIVYGATALCMINKQIGCLNEVIWWGTGYSGALTSEHIINIPIKHFSGFPAYRDPNTFGSSQKGSLKTGWFAVCDCGIS